MQNLEMPLFSSTEEFLNPSEGLKTGVPALGYSFPCHLLLYKLLYARYCTLSCTISRIRPVLYLFDHDPRASLSEYVHPTYSLHPRRPSCSAHHSDHLH